jgi:hypothetical protein
MEAAGDAGGDELFDALATLPSLGVPGSTFIFPTMNQVERTGVAAAHLAVPCRRVDLHAGAAAIERAAALSMLQEPTDHAPYGWTHCLTLPQAVLGIAHATASPRQALAVAATYVAGFRTSVAVAPLVDHYAPPDPGIDASDALRAEPGDAAAAVWHAPASAVAAIVTNLATAAATHEDAHLVKYVLACLDAAATHPAEARLYLAAAARLTAWWKAA